VDKVPTRKYFTKAIAPIKPPKPPVIKRSKQQFVVVRLPNGETRFMNSGYVAMKMGQSKGGERVQQLGKAHRWTSEEARACAKKLWATRWKMNRRINKRLGRPASNKPMVMRAALRAHYAVWPDKGIHYQPPRLLGVGLWILTTKEGSRVLSERAALIRLGHLPSQHAFIPKIVDGMEDASLVQP
jgi:hypothetical protein